MTTVRASAGAASLTIEVPTGVAARIRTAWPSAAARSTRPFPRFAAATSHRTTAPPRTGRHRPVGRSRLGARRRDGVAVAVDPAADADRLPSRPGSRAAANMSCSPVTRPSPTRPRSARPTASPPADSANTIVVIGKSDPPVFAACVVLATHRLDVNRTVKERLGTRKASFASPDETRALTGMEIGGVTAFGLPADLPLWVDAAVMDRPRIVLGGGSRSWKVIAPPSILRTLPNVEIVEGLAAARPVD